MKTLISIVSLFAVLAGAALFGPSAGAQATSCYPSTCNGPDAYLVGISHGVPMYAGVRNDVRVAGKNVGDAGSRIVTSLTSDNGTVDPHSQALYARKGQNYAFIFDSTPHHTGGIRLRACTTARPHDVNHSNDCGHTRARVKAFPRFH